MKWAIATLLVLVAVFQVGHRTLGYDTAYQVGYGAIAIMGVCISLTFLWLWWVRATPLALGMAFSWAGAASVMGWWWVFNLLDHPVAMQQNPGLFVFLSLYIVGATMHFRVIEDALSWPRRAYWLPVAGAWLLSLALWGLG